MNNFRLSHFKITILFVTLLLCACSSSKKNSNQTIKLESNEFDKLVKIEPVEVVQSSVAPVVLKSKKRTKYEVKKIKPVKIKKMIKKPKEKTLLTKSTMPTKEVRKKSVLTVNSKKIEVKPKVIVKEKVVSNKLKSSPFKVGEKTRIEVSYLNMTAGHLTLETVGVAKVNGRLSYHFRGSIKSRKLFSFVYSVDDVANTYVDVENLRPYSLEFKVVESKKTKNSKTFFDWSKMKATYWSRKVKKGRKPKETKKVWDLVEGSQNFVSALFYLRTIDFSKNKNFSFPLADEGKSILLKGKVLKKEKLTTDVGTFDAWVVEPRFQIKGSLAPVGSVKIWFRADESQELVKIETKLKFGSIVGEVVR